ncbi:hypothetical protein JKP88DRAFT_190919 [Tribonema minus]|uniref:Uncharacterized protein n=1 Tax=Tribonema minus TaxID=303371 RepID=A0A835ZIB1_9STRA|nr:hypothetical protein JKP88DRAFT_190919 [Tribonema minus]
MAKRAALVVGTAAPILALSGWSVYVTQERRKPPANTDFVVGSTDDILADKLKTGDLLLFRRNWALMQPPAAALALAARAVFNTRYDHVGLVIKDRFGVPLVLEVTQLGLRLRRFDERVSWSRSDEIVALPLRAAPPDEARVKAERYARSLTPERRLAWAQPSQSMSAELAGLLKYWLANRAARRRGTSPDAKLWGEGLVASRDAALVLATLDKMGLVDLAAVEREVAPAQLLSPRDLVEGRLPLTGGNAYLAGQELLVRLRDRSTRDR